MNNDYLTINWLETITGCQIKKEKWHNDYVPNLRYDFSNRFVLQGDYSTELATIDPNNIIRISYFDSYARLNWVQLLENLKYATRYMRNIHSFDDLIEFVNGENSISPFNYNKEGIYMLKLGDSYIVTGGQHRSCLAKFVSIKMTQVHVGHLYNISEKEVLDIINNKMLYNFK